MREVTESSDKDSKGRAAAKKREILQAPKERLSVEDTAKVGGNGIKADNVGSLFLGHDQSGLVAELFLSQARWPGSTSRLTLEYPHLQDDHSKSQSWSPHVCKSSQHPNTRVTFGWYQPGGMGSDMC